MLTRICMLLLLLSVSNAYSLSWYDVISKYKNNIDQNSLVYKQYEAFSEGKAPVIAHHDIKAINIVESHEELVDIRFMGNSRITMLPEPDKPGASPDCNAGFPHSSKVRKTLYLRLVCMVEQLNNLGGLFGYKPGQLMIKVFEGLRDLKTQELIFDNKVKEIKLLHPHWSDEDIEKEAAKWISPVKNNVPVHSTGAAVDIRLWDNDKNNFLDMGIFGAIWSPNPVAPTFSEEITEEQKENRLLCFLAAERAGLTNYLYEWWHYSVGDRYAAYWHEEEVIKRVAWYDAVRLGF